MSILIPLLLLFICLIWLSKTTKTGAIVGIAFIVILANVLSITLWLFYDLRIIEGYVNSTILVISDLLFWAISLYILGKRVKTNRLAIRHMVIISLPFVLMLLAQVIIESNSGIQR